VIDSSVDIIDNSPRKIWSSDTAVDRGVVLTLSTLHLSSLDMSVDHSFCSSRRALTACVPALQTAQGQRVCLASSAK
jgi:hypothetical protein